MRSPTAPLSEQLNGLGYNNQSMTVALTPDNPSTTAVDETAVLAMPGTLSAISCANSGSTPCGFTLIPGEEIEFGVVGAINSSGDFGFNYTSFEISVEDLCALP